jgi:hypothetical protein
LSSQLALAARERREQVKRNAQKFQRAPVDIQILVIESRRGVIAHADSSTGI